MRRSLSSRRKARSTSAAADKASATAPRKATVAIPISIVSSIFRIKPVKCQVLGFPRQEMLAKVNAARDPLMLVSNLAARRNVMQAALTRRMSLGVVVLLEPVHIDHGSRNALPCARVQPMSPHDHCAHMGPPAEHRRNNHAPSAQ